MRHELTTTTSEVGDRAANTGAPMLYRVILTGVSACLLVAATYLCQASNAHAQTASASTNYCWIDAATGKPAPLGPPGWSPTGMGGKLGENPDPNHVVHGGHTFVKQPDGTWIDAATGSPAPLGPPGWSPTGLGGKLGENPDANHVVHGGHTFVRVPCPPPAGAASSAQSGPSAQPAPDTGSRVPAFGFGFGIGGFGRGQDRSKDSAGRP